MTYVIIRRCPVCPTINEHVERLFTAFKKDRHVLVVRIDGSLDEFTILVDGEQIPGMYDDCLRPVEDLVSDIREVMHAPAAV
ncbi:hypothetical protein [Zavarzinella formosa]|uniref:hypothetical protein n=1 Tax=Zavarzinella formosa TaxID=360055 RepID=UPI0002E10F11|nr:hypothetical protein [Zavarzinella formosa]